MTWPQVRLVDPSFTLHPDPQPQALVPPARERSIRAPFGINPELYEIALRPETPLIFASLYIVTVFSLNAFNRRRNWKPWWIARQRWFNWFVVLHNALLTLYSAATFLAMAHALTATVPNLFHRDTSVASVLDSLCKMHGPRGFGDAVTYNTTINIWQSRNILIRTGLDGSPDSTDVGRLWNEGLAFWGWLFYISKFYEVIDTGIILAKGKRSATLQTYHHSGAMLCMWAGIRYMSPPIWMFVFVNSFIHALMYTYFTLSALGFKVPQRLKRTLTTMQIGQFIWGAIFASMHLFIQYDVPVATPYQVASTVKAAVAGVSSAAVAAGSSVSKILESPLADGALGATFKKLLLRAAGEEGIAELVDYQKSEPVLAQLENKIEQTKTIFETHWRTEYHPVNCIDTTGQIFAIYLNLFYLAPLTFLFGRFFVKAYTRWGKSSTVQRSVQKAVDAGKLAKEKTELIIEQFGKQAEDNVPANVPEKTEAAVEQIGTRAEEKVQDIREQFLQDVESMKSGTFAQNFRNGAGTNTSSTANTTSTSSNNMTSSTTSTTESSSFFTGRAETISSTTHFSAEDESVSKQEANLIASQETRPGVDDDTDAMGRSGAIIDSTEEVDDSETGGLLPPSPGRET